METYEARLGSFGTSKTTSKKGNINKKAQDGPQWPHCDPSPASLALAGFYYDPNETSFDRVTCCLCQTVLDGWEPSDDPIKEHISYSPNCGVAIHAKIEQDIDLGIAIQDDPTSEEMTQARKATFRDLWPHERKRGWTCKIQKMAEAGWYYSPTSDSDDFVKCAYCGLSLDGWEPKDKPLDEHERRSASCSFFTFQRPKKARITRSKKGRASKGSRLSTQSITAIVEDTVMLDASVDEGDTILTAVTDTTQVSTSKAKKTGRTKRSKSKSKAAKSSASIEPEDDDFEVKVVVPTSEISRGNKRKSEEMVDGQLDEDKPHPSKRRGTRARSSTAKPEVVTILENESKKTSELDAIEDPIKPAQTKAKRIDKGRELSSNYEVSAISTASYASFKVAELADEELDAALEADLERPLTDDEITLPSSLPPRPRAVSQVQTKQAIAPSASLRNAEGESTLSMGTLHTANEEMSSLVNMDESVMSGSSIKNPKRRTTRKAKQQAESEPIPANEEVSEFHEDMIAVVPAREAGPPRGKARQASRKPSRQVSVQKTKELDLPAPEIFEVDQAVTISACEEATVIDYADEGSSASANSKTIRRSKPSRLAKKSKQSAATKEDTPDATGIALATKAKIEQDRVVASEQAHTEDTKPKAKRGRPKSKKASKVVNEGPAHKMPEEPTKEQSIQPNMALQLEQTIQSNASVKSAENAQDLVDQPTDICEASTIPVKLQSPSIQQVPSPTPSPQSSDAENQPPSSRPSSARPPLAPHSPVEVRVPLATSTPTAVRTNLQLSPRLSTLFPWTNVDLDYVFMDTSGGDQENWELAHSLPNGLSSPEKCMTVEEWIRHQAICGQERLRGECERMVQRFENEGVRALKALEGIVANE